MALLQIDFRSQALKRQAAFQMILPIEKFKPPYPTLYLLHGLTENSSAWLHHTRIKMWAENAGLAVVMPSGENSFYLDIPVKDGCLGDFNAYIGEELVAVTREMFPLSRKRKETYIAGLSMGGYGACRNGLKYYDTFEKAAVLSGAVHFFEYPREWVKTFCQRHPLHPSGRRRIHLYRFVNLTFRLWKAALVGVKFRMVDF